MISFFSFFRRDGAITFDLSSWILIFLVPIDILLTPKLVLFSASRIISVFTDTNDSSAKAIVLIYFLNSKLRRELYCTFQTPFPKQDPCGQILLTSLSTCMVFVLVTAVLWLRQLFVSLYIFVGEFKSFRVISMLGHHAASKALLTSRKQGLWLTLVLWRVRVSILAVEK